ncbi:hypothetical protein [Pseudomonas sp. FP2300]|uniref:hypothetical protein n=1 Tax=Pseudomonas sp. FP2300 TaxID=2954090 RepID=UPI0027333894|nr:hypothetical protein [Pseudomonas sp. FP2300]WLH65319.1 hypothetical protein PSH86_12355 [Pseudomonas sp. FP2300]
MQTSKLLTKYTFVMIALKILCMCLDGKKGLMMSLDLFLEADSALTISALKSALENAGAWEIEVAGNGLSAAFASGLRLSGGDVLDDPTIYAENTKGVDFPVAVRCTIRIKGPYPEGESPMEDLDRIARSISQSCSAFFLISFQFEETLYWRDTTGLHRP